MGARTVSALLGAVVVALSCRSTAQFDQRPPCGAGGPFYAATPPDYVVRRSGHLDSAHASGQAALVVRLVDGPTDRLVPGASVRLSSGNRMFAPADEPTSDTDGIHTFVPIPAGASVLQIAYIGYHVQTLAHELRSGVSDTLTVTLLRGPVCLSH